MMMTDLNDTEKLQKVLRDLTVYGSKPSRSLLAETGVDADILQRVFESWRRHRDYMRSYQSFDRLFKQHYRWYSQREELDADFILKASGLHDKYRNTLVVASLAIIKAVDLGVRGKAWSSFLPLTDEMMTIHEREREAFSRFTIALISVTRDCEWIIFVNYPKAVFITCQSPMDAILEANKLLPEGTMFSYSSNDKPISSLALAVADGLKSSLERSIRQKEGDLEKEMPTLDQIERLLSTYRP